MILISAGDAIGAKLVKEAGFDGIWVSGFEASARLGLPDNGFITLEQMLNICKPIVKATELPVWVDVDTGYEDFRVTLDAFREIGVRGVCIEDVEPTYKTNSLWGDKVPLMDMYKFGNKIKIPRSPSFGIGIMARTEALIRGYGLSEAWNRAVYYQRVGADKILIHTRDNTGEEAKNIFKNCPIDVELLNLAIAPTKFPQYTNKELKEMGYSTIIWANQTERVKIKAVRKMLSKLKQHDRMLEAEKDLCATLDDMKGLACT